MMDRRSTTPLRGGAHQLFDGRPLLRVPSGAQGALLPPPRPGPRKVIEVPGQVRDVDPVIEVAHPKDVGALGGDVELLVPDARAPHDLRDGTVAVLAVLRPAVRRQVAGHEPEAVAVEPEPQDLPPLVPDPEAGVLLCGLHLRHVRVVFRQDVDVQSHLKHLRRAVRALQ